MTKTKRQVVARGGYWQCRLPVADEKTRIHFAGYLEIFAVFQIYLFIPRSVVRPLRIFLAAVTGKHKPMMCGEMEVKR